MSEIEKFDVIIIGGGINGLTCAAYLAKAGARVLVLERKGECGAHCDTSEIGLPGFLHNLHATWLLACFSPAMLDLELERYGLEVVMTEYAYGKTFLDGKCILLGVDPQKTFSNWMKVSPKDAERLQKAIELIIERWQEILDAVHNFLYTYPSWDKLERYSGLMRELVERMELEIDYEEIYSMNGFQILDVLFESDYVKTMLASLSWIAGFPPIHRTVGAVGCATLAAMVGPVFPVHQVKGGSHGLTHALLKCAVANGAKILPSCPVKKILVKNGEAKGILLSDEAIYPGETILADKIVSDLTVAPTFLELVGEENISTEMFSRIKRFSYDEQVLFGVYYALKEAPQWKSAEFDPGIQNCFMGYFGGESHNEMRSFAIDLVSGIVHEKIMANWFVPTIADPTQAPPGCHTAFVWLDVPPSPTHWKNKKFGGFKEWDKVKYELAEEVTETFEKYAPGFKKNILDMLIYTPLDIYRNNPSAKRGCWSGGANTPDQFFTSKPVPGVIVSGGSKTFIENLYLSNSIHPLSGSWLASGYIAACKVAEDLGIREKDWWKAKAAEWYIPNIPRLLKRL